MKKPTFSSFRRSLLALLNVLFLSDSFRTDSFFKVFQNFKSLSFYKVGISAIQNKLTVGFVFLFFFNSFIIFGQNLKAFTPSRFDTRLKGDMLLIGNNILNRNERRNERPNDAYNGNGYNSDFSMEYINVDSDGGKNFSSSTAKLTIPKPACYKVVYAGLYWGAILQQTDRSNIEKVRLKLPNATSYTDITGTIVYDANATPIGSGNNKPYACYADITSLVKGLSDAQGNYTVANVISSTGSNGTTGLSAGWSIFVVYEDPTLPAKYITTFDGFSGIGGPTTLDIPISGFKTIPTGPVRVKFAFSALEGDQQISGDYLQINGTAVSATNSAGTVIRGTNNFFNSSVTYIDPATGITENFQNRTPASTNTLGYDAGILNIDNPNNGIIANDATSAKITLGSTQDVYFYYFNAFAVDIIEPKIVLTKVVKNDKNQDIGNQNVTLGQILNYEIELQNIGNDNATSLTIRDVLPINTIFNYPTDPSSVTLPTGITVKSYNSSTREIVFDVNNSIVEVGDGKSKILLKVQVVPSCNMLSDACSNSIDNQAFATYKGTLNTNFTISDDPSINTNTGCLLVPKATNFLVGVDDCKFTKNEVLCGNSVVITAANGYNSYKWSTAPFDNTGNTTGTILGSNQTLTVTNPGTYYVYNTAIAPCLSITEAVTVSRFGGIVTNPVIPFADQVVTCPNDGKQLPNIFLCGLNATRAINTNISDGSTIVWEKLNEASCTAVSNQNCANENSSCTWTQVETGASYTANTSGQFRLTLNYPGGCFNRFYFNVYQNLLNPTETHRDIICNTKGNITIGGVPSGYEYSIDGTNYQASNSFTINTAGLYTVYIRQVGVTSNPCIFKVPNIQIRQRNFTVSTTVTQPLCFGEKGSIKVAANDVEPQYNFKIFNGGTLVNSVGPTTAGDYTFSNLTPGITYQVQVTTQDGCSNDQWIYISQPSSAVTANAAIVEPLTACNDGKIVITTQGGTGPYYYFVNGSSTFQTSNEIIVTTPGKYDILVVDSKNCSGTATVTVPDNSKPTYTIGNTNSTCYGNGSQITIGNIVANGYTMSYSIDNGATFSSNPVFSNLYPGTYNVVVKYTITYMSQWNGQQTKTCQDPAVTVTITGPTSAVSASAGVGELAGCGPLQGGQPTGLLRITNVQGGTAPYQYSYDGGNTWEASSQKYVVAGTYSLAVKDALGCTYQIPYSVILDPKPADPVIQDNVNTIYNCDGTATATVIVNNPASSGGTTYTYQYYLDNVLNTNTPTNTFLNVPSGSHTVKVKYDVSTVSSYSNLLSEDFGRGDDTTSPGINSAYCWEKQDGNTLAFATCSLNDWHPWLMNDGDYVVTKALLPDHFNDFNWWLPKDHTAVLNNTPSITDGRFLAVNIGATIPIGAVLYSKPINDVIPNQSINVSLYMANLLKASNNLPSPQLRVQLVKNGTVIASQAMPDIPRDEKWHFSTDLTGSVLTLNPGDNTSLDFQIISNSQVVTGNDLAIDDIQVYQIPKSCGNEREFPVIIDGSKAFKASLPSFSNPKCNGGNDGTITIAAENFNTTTGYQYNIDGGTFQTTTVSPFVLTGIGVGSHTIVVQNDATGTCSYTLKQVITSPTAVTVTASVTTLPTCTTGATITAIGSGGTPGYEFELRASDGTTVITGFQTSGIFTNVASGNYKVFVRDANLCMGSGTGVAVSVTAPTAPTATLASTSDLCYDTVNQASLVVNVSGGKSPFTYSLDGAAAQNGNTFTNVAPGTHEIVVTDSNNCTAKISNIVILDPLQLTATLTQDLTCLVNASMTTTVTNGYGAPYTYTVTRNGVALPAPTFPYTTSTDGSYVFTVTDSKGCPATSNAIVVSAKTTPTLTFVKTDITCNNANDGTITVTASNGFTTAYTYAIKTSAATTYTPQASNKFTPLAAGTYNIKVIDSKGCESAVTNVTIVNPDVVTGTINATELGCSTSGTVPAVVTVAGAGGTSPYKYSFNGTSNFTNTNTYSISAAGIVTAYIQDFNGCQIGPLSVTIAAIDQITGITITDSGWDCSSTPAGGHVNIAAVKGNVSAPIRYQIISGPAGYSTATNSDGEFKGLAPGAYVFQATDIKTGCSFTKSYTVNGVPDIVAGGSVLTPIKCFGGTGTIQFTVGGVKDRGYDYVIKNAANTIIQSANGISETITTIAVPADQPTGSYTITVTDRKTKCTATYTVILTQPSAAVSITSAVPTNVNCNNDNSQITVIAAGGTPNYTYAAVKSGTTAPTVYASSNVVTVDTNSSVDLVWDVYVKDANGCTTKSTVTIISDPVPSVTAVISNQCTGTGSNFVITATGTGGIAPLTYGINGVGGAFQAGNTFNVAASATPYTVWVKDANGCTNQATPLTVYPQLASNAVVTKTLDCSGTPDAVITTTITGGKAPYTYTVQKGAGAPSASSAAAASFTYNVSNANADTYKFVITDANGCTSTTTAIVNPITNPTVTPTPTQVSCNGGSNGAVSLAGAGGSGGYTYSFNGSAFTATTNYTGLSADIAYPYQVKDSKGCVSTPATITLTAPTALVVSASATDFSCSATNTKQAAVVTIDVPTTGTAPYTYSFNGGGYTGTRTLTVNDNGTDQTINYSVQDANGCTKSSSITINKLNPPTDLGFSNAAVTCSAPTTTVTLTATNGVGSLQYETIAPSVVIVAKQTSNVFAGLASGNYTFKVTDANGCYYTESYAITPVTPIAIAGNVTQNVDCKGNATGKATFTVSGNATVGAYTFVLTTGTLGAGTLTKANDIVSLTNVAAGSYTVEVTDTATGCKKDASVTITEPAAAVSITSAVPTNVNCNNDNSQITVMATGGTTNYSYAAVKSGATAPTVYASSNVVTVDTNSSVDLVWDVYVKDANGCTTKSTVTIISDPVPSVTAVISNQCTGTGSNFVITATGTGGIAPLTYGINGVGGAFQAGNTFNVAASATPYTVWVKDANGCTNQATPLTVYPQLASNAVVTKTLDCSGTPDAVITTTITGGKAPYTYTVQKGAGAPSASSAAAASFTYSVSNANADTYKFVITDANGCTSTTTAIVNPITNPTVTPTPTQVSCNGGSNGAVSLAGAGGSGGYTYSFNGSAFTATTNYTGLSADIAYPYQVKDSKGCVSAPATITLTAPTALVVSASATDFSCSATNTKQAAVVTIDVPTTGTAPYTYSFNGGGYTGTRTLTVNDNGTDQTINYSVQDANGCTKSSSITINKLNPPTITGISHSDIYCFPVAKQTSQVTVSAVNGLGTLTYEITSPLASATSNTTGLFTGLAGGITYTFKVTDAKGCFAISSHTVPPVTPIAVTATKLTDVDCNGGTTGSARFTVTGFSASGNYTITVTSTPASLPYTLSPSGDIRTLTGLVAGTYTFSVTDITTGCIDSKSVIITQPAALAIVSATATNVFCTNGNSQIKVTATGGTTNYGYAAVLSGAPAPTVFGTSNVITVNTNSGADLVWDVYVRDAKGCTTAPTTVTIINNGTPTVTALVTNQCSASGSSFQIKAVGADGLAPYTYTINTGLAPSPADTFTVAAGTYTITVKDANGCTSTTSVTVNQVLSANAVLTKDLTCAAPTDASMTITVSGGKAPFGYRVAIGAAGYSGTPIAFAGTSFTYTAATADTFKFEITDANGCVKETNVISTTTPVPVTATYTKVDPTCNGFSDGSIKLTALTGVAPFTYSITGAAGTFVSSNVFGGLVGGSYDYAVKDAKGCIFNAPLVPIVLNDPAPIVVNIVRNAIQCNTNTPGSFDVNVTSGGTAPYVYKLYDNSFTQIATYTEASAASTPVFSFTGLNFGDYYITVVDAKGCEFKSPKLRIETPPFLQQTFLVNSNNCATGVDVEVTTSGGTGPFKYSIFGQPLTETAPLASNVYTFTGLLHGVTYFFQVKDSFNCISIKEFTTPAPPSSINITGTTSTNVTCNGSPNGTLAFTVQDYDATVTKINYEVVNALTLLPLSTPVNGSLTGAAGGPVTGNITTLPAGNYVLKVTEDTGTLCSATYTFSITQPAQALASNIVSVVNANCNSGALVTLNTTGGTGPYTYAAAAAPTVPSTFTVGNVLNLDYSLGNNWNITVKDANGCTVNLGQIISKDPSPVIALSVIDKCVVEGTFGVKVTETAGGVGPYTLSVNNSVFTSIPGLPYTVTGLNSGLNTVVIKDANGCTDTKSITIDTPLILTLAITALPTCADNDGVITMSGTGGTGTYTYTISPVAGTVTGNLISGLPAGTYTVTMTDTATPTNCTTTAVVTLGAPTPVTFTTATTPALCVGDNNGTITVTLGAGNNNPSYTYEIIAGPQLAVAQSSNIFTGLLPGTYTVRVNSGRGCRFDDTNVIVAPATPLTATATFPANTTCSTVTVITVSAGGGTGSGYLYNFNGLGYTSDPTYTVNDNGSVQTISYRVKDGNGCETALKTIDVNPLSKPTDLDFVVSTAPTCPTPTTGVTVTATNGVGALTFEIIQFNGAPTALYPPQITAGSGVSAVFNNLPVGDYMFQVTDANGCTYQESYTVKPVTNITVATTATADISCFGSNNGSATFKVANFSSTYTAVLTAGTGVPVIASDVVSLSALTPGAYTLRVTDVTTGCTADVNFTIAEPTALNLVQVSNVNANCNSGAKVSVLASGGTPNYSYAFVADNATPLATDYTSSASAVLPFAGTLPMNWDVWVKDANGCTFKLDIVTNIDALPTIVLPTAQCFVGSPLTIDLSLPAVTTVPRGPVKYYTINGSDQTSPIYTITAPGTYTLSVTDANGCASNVVNYIVQPQLVLDAVLTQDLTCAVNASINLTATGGTGTYNPFEVSFNGGGFGPASNPYTALVDGSYVFRVTDNQVPSCPALSTAVVVTPKTTPSATFTQTNVSCIGGNDGSIIVTAANGIAPYQYSIDNGGSYQPSNVFNGLTDAGVYNIMVKDAKNCLSVAIPVDITQPTAITASAAVTPFGCDPSNAPQDATVTINAIGGTVPYSYSFDNGANWQTSSSHTFNTAQTINYVVHDANGCSFSGSAIVPTYAPPKDMDLSASPIYCSTVPAVASVTVNGVTGGVLPYTYDIISPITVNNSNNPVFIGLAPNTYVIKVTDANGCSTTKAIEVKEADKISVSSQIVNDVYCNGGATAAVNFTVANYITAGKFTPVLNPNLGTMTINGDVISYTNLPKGNYTFTITDDVSQCFATANITINEPAVALSSTSVATHINCTEKSATITVTPNGGTAPYKYAVAKASAGMPAAASFVASNQLVVDTNNGADMNWIVYVKDANGCDANNAQAIVTDVNPTIASAVATQCPSTTGTYAITVKANGFNSALQYSVDGVSFQMSNIITVNAPGTYNVTVKDANGCSSIPTSVAIAQPLVLTPKVTTMPSCTDNDGVITVSATGGSGSYVYNIDNGSFGAAATFNNIASGSHSMGVRDTTTLCEVYVPITLTPATPVTGFALSKTDVTCKGGNDGTITATMATPGPGINDNPVYMYSLNGGTPQVSNVFTGLTAGSYNIVVTSGRGCTAPASISVIEPGIITIPAPTVAQFGCNAGSNSMNSATITVAGVTGGSGTYTVYEFIKGGVVVQRGASNMYTETNVAGGNYTVTVYDSKGCQGSTAAPIVIAPFISLDKVNVTVNRAITCNNSEDITVSATTTGGTPAVLNYTVAGTGGNVYNQTKTTGIFTGLTVGDYVITVTNPTTGCSSTSVHYVNAPNTFELKAVKTSDVKCYGSNEGAVQLTVVDTQLVPTNDAGAFTYTLTRPNGTTTNGNSATAGPLTLSGLTAGAYKVTATLTNSPFCSVTTNFTIDQPSAALTVTETHTAITCIAGNNDGTISAVATGGWSGGYEFQLELASGTVIRAWATSPDFTGLVAGNYIVKVRDTKLCVSQVSVPLVNPTPITITATPSVTKVSCFGDKSATITAAANGGQGSNYLYTLNYTSLNPVISSGPQSSPVFTGLGAGSYSITVTDGWSCSVTSTVVTINEPTEVQANLVLASSQTCKTQSRLTLSATGGTAPYRYSATSNIATSVAMVGNSITFPVGNGTFHYYVWDANGCASYISNDISNDPLEPLAVGLDVENAVINCRGDLTGVIVAEAKGGLGNYVYTLVNGSGVAIAPAPVQSTPGRFEGLAAGTYKVSVTSGDCNIVSGTVTITEPVTALTATPTVVNVTCNGNNNGEITINASGGTGIIKYAISPNLDQFFVTNKFVNLKPGFYDLIAQDENGCYVYMKNVQIIEPTPVDVKVDTTKPLTQELCAGDKSGAFSVVITGGTAPYSTVLDNPKGTYVLGQVDFPGLSGGTHTVYVKDAQSCTFELVVPLDMPVTLNPTAVVSNDCVNNAAANKVTVTVDPSNNPADVKYSLDNSGVFQISNVFTNIAPGDHFIMVEHKNGCADATAPFKINKVDPLTISLSLGGLNEIVATVTGGSGVYQFTVNGESIGSNNKYIYFKSGDYTVTVSDSYGCSVSATKYFEFIDIKIPPIFTPNGDGENDNWKPTNTENYPDIKFIIYDRYGRQVGVFGAGQSWDGKYNGTELPMGDYWYILKLRHAQDDREFVGHFTLYR